MAINQINKDITLHNHPSCFTIMKNYTTKYYMCPDNQLWYKICVLLVRCHSIKLNA